MTSASLVAEADALHEDFDAILRLASGQAPTAIETSSNGEALVASFGRRVLVLQQAFAAQRIRDAAAACANADDDGDSLREQISALQHELAEKDRLLRVHRERLVKWRSICGAVQADAQRLSLASQLEEVKVGPERSSPPPTAVE
jgi:hypothetical protein